MSEKLLVSSSSGALASRRTPPMHRFVYLVCVVVGMFVVLYGAADVLSRFATIVANTQTNRLAFGPAVLLFDTPTTSQLATTTLLGEPATLTIAALGVEAPIESLGLDAHGAMATPKKWGNVGWYSLGSRPGEPGSTVIAGHVNNALTRGGVFEHLGKISLGDKVLVTDTAGRVASYSVSQVIDYAAVDAPIEDIFSITGPSQLVLVTCAGEWDPRAHSYNQRLVVFARLVP